MGLKWLRVCICWGGILGNGEDGEGNEGGVGFYERVLDEVDKDGIERVVRIWDYEMRVGVVKK